MKKNTGYKIGIVIILLLQLLYMFFWANQKDAFFIDEFYTYENVIMANSNIKASEPGFRWGSEDGFVDTYHNGQEFEDHFIFSKDNSVFTMSFPNMIKKFLSIKPYYFMLNMIMSMIPGGLSKWYAIGFNMFLFILLQAVLYIVSKELFREKYVPIAIITIWGFCAGAVSSVIYIRFYTLFILCTMLITYCHIKLIKSSDKQMWYILGTLIATFIGYKNAEYTLLFAGFIGMSYVLIKLYKKNVKEVLTYIGTFITAAVVYIIMNPSILHKFEKGQGATAKDNLLGRPISEMVEYLREYYRIIQSMTWSKKWLLLCIIIIIMLSIIIGYREYGNKERKFKSYIKQIKDEQENDMLIESVVMIGFTCLAYFIMVCRIAPWIEWRYMSCLFPLVIILIIKVISCWTQGKKQNLMIGITTLCMVGIALLNGKQLIEEVDHGTKKSLQTVVEQNCGHDNYMYVWLDQSIDVQYTASLYYCAYLWPDEAQTYVVRQEDILTKDYSEVFADGDIYLWVQTADWENNADSYLKAIGKNSAEHTYDVKLVPYAVYRCY